MTTVLEHQTAIPPTPDTDPEPAYPDSTYAEPAQRPTGRPTVPGPRLRPGAGASEHEKEEGRRVVRQVVEQLPAGERWPSGAQLAEQYPDRKERWWRDRLAEVRAEHADRPAADAEHTEPSAEPETAQLDQAQTVPTDTTPEPATPQVSTPGMPTSSAYAEHPRRRHERQGRGRVTAAGALVLGILASIAANVLSVVQHTADSAALAGAAFWPCALLLSVEVVIQVRWPDSWWYAAARVAGVSLVALVAALVSYQHVSALLDSWGYDPVTAHLGPLAVEGMIVLGAVGLVAETRSHRAPRAAT